MYLKKYNITYVPALYRRIKYGYVLADYLHTYVIHIAYQNNSYELEFYIQSGIQIHCLDKAVVTTSLCEK